MYGWLLVGVRDRGGVGVRELGEEEVECWYGIGELPGESELFGFILFSFWRRLQNQTLTTSFSRQSPSEMYCTSSLLGLGLELKALSSATLTVLSMLVLFGPAPGLPAPAASTSASKVPTDAAPSLQDALLNLQKTASASSFPAPPASLLANPLASLLASQGAAGLSGLPKPADLIQQAQTLQLLAHLQTMLMTPGSGQPSAPSTGLPGPLNNAANFQKVYFIHIYEEAQNKRRFNQFYDEDFLLHIFSHQPVPIMSSRR